jgi:hypothetical protein
MDKSCRPTSSRQSCFCSKQQDPSPTPPNVPHMTLCLVLSEMLSFPVVQQGGSQLIYPRQVLLGLNNPPPWTLPVLLLAPLRSSPSSPLCKSLCLNKLATGLVLQSMPPLMQRPLPTPAATTTTTTMITTTVTNSLGSSRTLIPKISRHVIFVAILFCYFLAQGSARSPTPRKGRFYLL